MKTTHFALLIAQTALLSSFSVSALATTDTYRHAFIPVEKLQESGYCFTRSLVLDATSAFGTAEGLALSELEVPLWINSNIVSAEMSPIDANALSKSGIWYELQTGEDPSATSQLTIHVDRAFAKLERAEALKASKLAIYASVKNALSVSLKQVRVKVVGLPAQQGPKPIPATFNSAFSAASPYLKQLASELEIDASCVR